MPYEYQLGNFLKRIGPDNIKGHAVQKCSAGKYRLVVWTRNDKMHQFKETYASIDEAQRMYKSVKRSLSAQCCGNCKMRSTSGRQCGQRRTQQGIKDHKPHVRAAGRTQPLDYRLGNFIAQIGGPSNIKDSFIEQCEDHKYRIVINAKNGRRAVGTRHYDSITQAKQNYRYLAIYAAIASMPL